MPIPEISANNLKQAKEILRSLRVPMMLFLGTALGAYRDGDFCPGDVDDIDLAIPVAFYPDVKRIIQRFEDAGFELEHHWCEEDGIAPEVSFVKKYDDWRSKIDLFFLSPYKGQVAWKFYGSPTQIRMIDKRFFDIDLPMNAVQFYGESYVVPSPIEEYLEANYGPDWRTPIPRDKWDWEHDNKLPYE